MEKQEKTFEDVVKGIEQSEANVDKVLKAGRLERHEKIPMTDKRLEMIFGYLCGIIAMIGGFGALFMIIYFMGTAGR